MPTGTYHHLDDDGGLRAREVFSCAPGPAGWRYVSQSYDPDGRPLGRLDLTCDRTWRQLRVQVDHGGWTVRGGLTGREAVWLRTGGPTSEEHTEPAAGFTGSSAAFSVVTARLLALDLLDRRRVRLLRVTEPACAVVPVDEGWALVDRQEHATDDEPLLVERYEVADLATAVRRVVHLAGDVVVDAPGIELAELESRPTRIFD